jgi:hypothetical protein
LTVYFKEIVLKEKFVEDCKTMNIDFGIYLAVRLIVGVLDNGSVLHNLHISGAFLKLSYECVCKASVTFYSWWPSNLLSQQHSTL